MKIFPRTPSYVDCFSRGELFLIDLRLVCYCQAMDHYTNVVLVNGETHLLTVDIFRIEAAIASLSREREHFVRLGRSHIINLRFLFYASTSKGIVKLFTKGGKETCINASAASIKELIQHYSALHEVKPPIDEIKSLAQS